MNTGTFRPVALPLLIAALSFLAPGSIRAAAIFIDDTNPNEILTVTANDFEGGLLLNGVLFQQGLHNPATGTFPETDALNFSGTWITDNQQGPVDRTIFLIESPIIPGAAAPLVSDILRFQITPNTDNGTATIQGSFVSDTNDNLGTLPTDVPPENVFLETGNPVDLSFFALSFSVKSDAEIPEPSTWVLLASALLGFGGYRLCRRSS